MCRKNNAKRIRPSGSQPDASARRVSGRAVLALLCAVLVVSVVSSFCLGRYPVSLRAVAGILFSRLPFARVTAFWSSAQAAAVLNVRLPRILLAVLVGSGLSAAGAAYQGVFRNPIASPDVLGASTGAGFGAALAIFLGLSGVFVTMFAFVFGLFTVFLVFFIGNHAKGERLLGLVLSGILISSLFQAGISFLKLVADPSDRLPSITYWLMGSLSGAERRDVRFVVLPMLAGFLPLWLLRWRMNILTMGDDAARSLGVDAPRVRLIVVLGATLLTAASVSVSGLIGWVGLVIPHISRRLAGSDYRILLPASALMGGAFLLLVDDLSRILFPTEIPLGILTSFLGAPVFLALILRRDTLHA